MSHETEDGIPSHVERAATVGEVAEAMRHAAAEHQAVVPRGLGTKLHWGSPPRGAALVLDVNGVNDTLDHVPDDMIVTASAGVSIRDLVDVLAEHGQQLAIDVCGYDDGAPAGFGTVGGLLSTACDGARRWGYGAARDLLLGIEMVRADGEIAHAGGRVVKNVAGYDLGKLSTGAYGTLGILTQATFRVHPLPEATAFVVLDAADPETACRRAADILDSQLAPVAVDVEHHNGTASVAAMFEGSAAGVRSRAEAAATLSDGEVADAAPEWFNRMPLGPADTLLRVALPPAEVARLCHTASALAEKHEVPSGVRGSAGTGVLYCALPRDTAVETVAAFLADLRQSLAPRRESPASGESGGARRSRPDAAADRRERPFGADGSGGGSGGSSGYITGRHTAADQGFLASGGNARARGRGAAAGGGAVTPGGYVTVRHAPAEVRRAVDVWGPSDPGARALAASIKRQFDPDELLSPGRMGEEA
jgi:glycolate oxidase FAD binding subunit